MKINLSHNSRTDIKLFGIIAIYILSPLVGYDDIYLHMSMILLVSLVVYVNRKDSTIPFDVYAIALFLLFILIIYIFVSIVYLGNKFSVSLIQYFIQVFAYLLFAGSVNWLFAAPNRDIAFFIKIFSLIAILNSLVIIVEAFSPFVHNVIEGFLGQRPEKLVYATNIEKFRGFATSSGANLSFYNGLSITMLAWLYTIRRINLSFFLISIFILFVALLWIGRTGFFISIIGIFLVLSTQIKASLKNIIIIMLVFYLIVQFIIFFGSKFFEAHHFKYLFGFMLEGYSGIIHERSVADLLKNHYKFPTDFWMILFGNGNYSGNFGHSNSDPGIIRMISAVGFPITLGFYLIIFLLIYKYLKFTISLPIILIIVFIIAEFKEPFIIKGYSARELWFLIGYSAFDHMRKHKYEI